VLIAEHLIGKGFDLKIHDPAIETSLITGTNREYIQQHIPHLSKRMVHRVEELVDHAEVLLMTRDDDELLERVVQKEKRPIVVDLRGQNHLMKRMLQAKRRAKATANHDSKEPNGAQARNGEPETRKRMQVCA